MATTTVRVSAETRDIIKRLAIEAKVSIPDILARAVEVYRRQRLFDESDKAYVQLRADPVAWAQELEERRLWEGTLLDGIENEK